MRTGLVLLYFFLFTFAFLLQRSAVAAEAKPTWQTEWEKTLQAAKKEGQLVIYGQVGGPERKAYVEAFQQAYPWIRVGDTSGRLSGLVSRIMAERRAGKYLVDLLIGGTTTPLETLKPAVLLEPIRPLLVLPEVTDPASWLNKKLWFADREQKFMPLYRGSLNTIFSVNTNLTQPSDFKTYFDLLNPKWKGKIAAQDPRTTGSGGSLTIFLYSTPSLGPKFLKRLFGEMDITFSRDRYQVLDWVARGRFAINLFAPVGIEDIKAGLPIVEVRVEGPEPVAGGAGSVSLMTRAPHPNAAKLFINWLLSREGQMAYQKATGYNSLRTDIPKKGIVEPAEIPQEGREYFFYSLEENRATKEFVQFLSEVIPRR